MLENSGAASKFRAAIYRRFYKITDKGDEVFKKLLLMTRSPKTGAFFGLIFTPSTAPANTGLVLIFHHSHRSHSTHPDPF